MSQELSDYGTALDRGQAGQKADAGNDHVETFAAEGAVPFGHAVVRGTEDRQGAVPSADTDEFVGIALFTHVQRQGLPGEDEIAGYEDTDPMSVLRRGRALVEVTADVDAGDSAYVDVQAGDEGLWTNVATDNLGPVGQFKTSADDGDLAVVEVDALTAAIT